MRLLGTFSDDFSLTVHEQAMDLLWPNMSSLAFPSVKHSRTTDQWLEVAGADQYWDTSIVNDTSEAPTLPQHIQDLPPRHHNPSRSFLSLALSRSEVEDCQLYQNLIAPDQLMMT